MNYQLHYDRLIDQARSRSISGYTEKHHVIPKCLGGHDSESNIVRLTAEEHYLAHQLLMKLHPSVPGIIYAAKMMTTSNGRSIRNNKLFGWIRRKSNNIAKKRVVSEETRMRQSTSLKGRKSVYKGGPGPNAGKTMSKESRQKMSDSRKGVKRGPYKKNLNHDP